MFFKAVRVCLGKLYFQKRGKKSLFPDHLKQQHLRLLCVCTAMLEKHTLARGRLSRLQINDTSTSSSSWEASSSPAQFGTTIMTFGLSLQVQDHLTCLPDLLQHCAGLISPPSKWSNKKHSTNTPHWGLETEIPPPARIWVLFSYY